MKKRSIITRRKFIKATAGSVAMFQIVPRHVLGGPGFTAPSDKLQIACVGVGGQGNVHVIDVGRETIVAMCDVDDKRAVRAYKRYEDVPKFKDFRVMLDKMDKDIDAVTVATPDHTHAVIAMAAMERGKHVYCEKPLAHSIHELRTLRQAAIDNKVITQVGNHGHSSARIRLCVEWIRDGAIGQVKEVHAGTNAFSNVYCPIRKLGEITKTHKIPAELDWDLWQGPVAERPYCRAYAPFDWRGWLPYGAGAIGDWICHVVDPVFWALELGIPTSVIAEVDKSYDPVKHAECYPAGAHFTFEFAATKRNGPVTIHWYDGNMKIPHGKHLEPDRTPPPTGAIIVGENSSIMHGSHGAGSARIIPELAMRDYKLPEPTIPRIRGSHHGDWIASIKAGRQAGSNFEYGGSLSEIALLGIIALRQPGKKLLWDAKKMVFTNSAEATALVNIPYRKPWTL